MSEQGDRVIYFGWNGKAVRSSAEMGNPDSSNFVIQFNDRDWSGFRPLHSRGGDDPVNGCFPQFNELAAREDGRSFTIIER